MPVDGTSRILVADDDAWILRMVTTVLEKRGYDVDTAADGDEAYTKALAVTPDLVITDVMMPKMDGWALVKALRARPEFAFVPVIFLTALGADDDRIKGFRLGADDYLPKPFRFEELDLRVAKTLKRRAPMEASARHALVPAPQEPTGLRGALDQVGLPSLLTLLEMERKSGVLLLDNERGETARIFVRNGRVLRALLEGRDTPHNEECVYYLIDWSHGSFQFNAGAVEIADEVNQTTTHLLMEGARRIDEADRY